MLKLKSLGSKTKDLHTFNFLAGLQLSQPHFLNVSQECLAVLSLTQHTMFWLQNSIIYLQSNPCLSVLRFSGGEGLRFHSFLAQFCF